MIKGKAKLEFGTGTICMVPSIRIDGIGALHLRSCEPHEIGKLEPMPKTWAPTQSEVIMTFTNHKSVEALIIELSHVYKSLLEYECRGTLPDEHWGREIDLDYDSFMEVAHD